MPTVPLHEVKRGSVVTYNGSAWLVLDSGLGPFPHGFFPPMEFKLQPLPSGPIREISLLSGMERLEVLPTDRREFEFVCRQQGEAILFDPASGEMLALTEDWTDLSWVELTPQKCIAVRYFAGQPVWITATWRAGEG